MGINQDGYVACDPVAPVPARYNRSKRIVRHLQCLVWLEMSGNLLKTSTFQPGEMGGCSNYMLQ
jgi:hypothetical protein